MIVLYNGLHFPAAMLDKALNWTATNSGDMIALFLVSDKEQDEGYPFPNDLDEADEVSSDDDAVGTDLAIIASNIRLLRHQAKSAGIALATQILPAANLRALQPWLEKANLILVSKEPIDPPILSLAFAQIEKMMAEVSVPIEWVE